MGSVDMQCNDFDDNVGEAIFNAVAENDATSIQKLNFSDCGFGPKTASALINCIKRNKTTVEIFLVGNQMFDTESAKQLAEAVERSDGPLETLVVDGIDPRSEAAEKMRAKLGKWNGSRGLYLA